MKKLLSLLFSASLALALLAACGGNGNSAAAPSAPPANSAAASGAVAPGSAGQSAATAENLEALLPGLVEAANLGADPTPLTDPRDFSIQFGVAEEDVLAFTGAQSKLLYQTGAEVVLVQAQPGRAADVKTAFESYRDRIVSDDRYADNEDARTNVSNARIQMFGDVVVYAVSATGEWDALDAAIAAAFA